MIRVGLPGFLFGQEPLMTGEGAGYADGDGAAEGRPVAPLASGQE